MDDQKVRFLELEDVERQRAEQRNAYREFLRIPAMSAGVYVLAAGSVDRQTPHKQDELYYVVRGRARMRAGSDDRQLRQGTLIFVAAEVEHLFYEIEEELTVLVFFAPAETE